MNQPVSNVDFGLIRYANCWEDADILLQGMSLQAGANVLCIASAGDNALSLLATQPESVHAIDVSKVQLYLTELKQMSFATLEYDELLQFLGIHDHSHATRQQLYKTVSKALTADTRTYWDARSEVIEQGVIYCGKFEQYFHKYRKYVLPLAHKRQTVHRLLEQKSQEEQEDFYHNRWDSIRLRILMNIFFSKYVMGKYGRDPQFLKQVKIPVAKYIRQKTEQHLQSRLCQDNYFLHMIFTGSFGNTLPHYLREENFESIRSNIHKLQLIHTSAHEAVAAHSYDAYCFSNIFEYFSEPDFDTTAKAWAQHIPAKATLAYWNLMAQRSLSETNPQAYIYNSACKALTDIDKGFFYSRFIIEKKT